MKDAVNDHEQQVPQKQKMDPSIRQDRSWITNSCSSHVSGSVCRISPLHRQAVGQEGAHVVHVGCTGTGTGVGTGTDRVTVLTRGTGTGTGTGQEIF